VPADVVKLVLSLWPLTHDSPVGEGAAEEDVVLVVSELDAESVPVAEAESVPVAEAESVPVADAESVAVLEAESVPVAVASVAEADSEDPVALGTADETGLGTFLPVQTKSRLTAVVMLPFM
jgi:hypothetical protein